jgi:hypothetical protein
MESEPHIKARRELIVPRYVEQEVNAIVPAKKTVAWTISVENPVMGIRLIVDLTTGGPTLNFAITQASQFPRFPEVGPWRQWLGIGGLQINEFLPGAGPWVFIAGNQGNNPVSLAGKLLYGKALTP